MRRTLNKDMKIRVQQPGIIQGTTVLSVDSVVEMNEPRARQLIKAGLVEEYHEMETATADPVVEIPEKLTNHKRRKTSSRKAVT